LENRWVAVGPQLKRVAGTWAGRALTGVDADFWPKRDKCIKGFTRVAFSANILIRVDAVHVRLTHTGARVHNPLA